MTVNRVTYFVFAAAVLLGVATTVQAPRAASTSPAAADVYGNTDPSRFGRWDTVIPRADGAAVGKILGMQTVHAVLLPSGKVLFASGSSWRNRAPVQAYPRDRNPQAGTGLFDRAQDPFQNAKLASYYRMVNNVAIYDPEANTFYRIPHPVPVPDPHHADHFAPDDLFCTGHQQLPDGNVLFIGGTQYYAPYRTGNNSTFIFDWKKELTINWPSVDWRRIPAPANDPWTFAGFMQRGRWYASAVPLLDGRLAIFGGFVGFDEGYPPMYTFEMNSTVDFFDPARFDPLHPQAAWRNVDVKSLPNSPYTTLINPGFRPTPNVACDARCVRDNQYDEFKLYPENYLLPDGRIFLTREGDWVSARTCDAAFMRRTRRTYWARIGGTRDQPTVQFAPGPDRPDEVSSYGTSLFDPNSGMISIIGGQPTSAGTFLPPNSVSSAELASNCVSPPSLPPVTHFAGGRGSRKIETLHLNTAQPGGGSWTLDPNFLGTSENDDRTMHYAIVLPTRQILIINGGNYDFYGPVHAPLLLTPTFQGTVFTGYRKERMSEGVEPRLYHNNAVLLPDGRILVSGGNTTRALLRDDVPPPTPDPTRTGQPLPNLGEVDLDRYFFADGPQGKGQPGELTTPSEDWVAEMFSPPYLFIDPGRRAAIDALAPVNASYPYRSVIGGKTFYLMRSGVTYDVSLTGLPTACSSAGASLVLIKLPSATHGWQPGQQFVSLPFHVTAANRIRFTAPIAQRANIPPAFYMMFYVDCRGKPSVAQMVRFDDTAPHV